MARTAIRLPTRRARAALARQMHVSVTGLESLHSRNALAAHQKYRKLSPELRWRVAHILATEFMGPIRVACPDILSVGIGLKRRRLKNSKTGFRFNDAPSLIFVVRKKWHSMQRVSSFGAIPQFIGLGVELDGERATLAVKTDVEEYSRYGGITMHGTRIGVDTSTSTELGVLACMFTYKGQLYGLGCKHVLSFAGTFGGVTKSELSVHCENSESAFGTTTSHGGALVKAPAVSFDAQLLVIDEPTGASSALNGVSFYGKQPYIAEQVEMAGNMGFTIITGRDDGYGSPLCLDARFVRFWYEDRRIDCPGVGEICLSLLLECHVDPPAAPGDSGSPAAADFSGRTLIGMHIAGKDNMAFLIPAWQLMDPTCYGLPDGRFELK